MKAASVVFTRNDSEELTSYKKLIKKVELWLELCCRSNMDIVVFPALLGSIFSDSREYINDIVRMSLNFKGLAICPGSYYETESENTYHSSCVIIDGSIILEQRQIYLAKWEAGLGLSRGTKLNSISLCGMKLGLLISTDVFYPQVSRAHAMSGVELVLAPVAFKGGMSMPRQLSGLWQNVQSNLFFGIESGFKGSLSGHTFHSSSLIHAPLDMTEEENGFLAMEEESGETAIIFAELDNEKRKAAVCKFNTLAQLNIEAYKDIFRLS